MDRPSNRELDAVMAAVEELRDLEAQVADAKQRLASKVDELAEIRDPSALLRAALYAYWHAPEVNANQLAVLTVGKPSATLMLKRSGSVSIDIACDRCGKDLPITSRSMMNEVLKRTRNNERRFSEGYRYVCEDCQEAIYKQRKESQKRAEQEMNERRRILAQMSYEQYLATPEWKARRESVLSMMLCDRGKLTCELCPEREGLAFVHSQLDLRSGQEIVRLLCATCSTALAQVGKLAHPLLPANRAPRIELDLRERDFRSERDEDLGDDR